MPTSSTVPPSDLRVEFSRRLSSMYAAEVPLYAELIEMVKRVNRDVIEGHPELGLHLVDLDRISAERHGAVRLGRDDEMATLARLFAILGMQPVNTYDLSAAGAKAQPVLSTAFRAVGADELSASPLRIFCSLLRVDDERFFDDPDLRRRMHAVLARRQIFSDELLSLIATAEDRGGLPRNEADRFLDRAVEVFRWRGQATEYALYEDLRDRGLSIAADICCFPNPHLNHLTPNTLDIDDLQARMERLLSADHRDDGAAMKDHIEGPPRRRVPILLRQTAYRALTETVHFDGDREGCHTARFGEIEQRGAALTPAGRRLYDEALENVEATRAAGSTPDLAAAFAAIPDNLDELRRRGLVFVDYAVTEAGAAATPVPDDLEACLEQGLVSCQPLRYEDFLPVSAAGIFASNLRQSGARHAGASPHGQAELEAILGRPVLSADALYAAREARSLLSVHERLALSLDPQRRRRLEEQAAAC